MTPSLTRKITISAWLAIFGSSLAALAWLLTNFPVGA